MLDVLGQLHSLSWIYSALLWIALASTILIIIIILSENRNPVKSLAWVTVLLLLPVVGLVLYLFFGRNIKNTRMITRRNRRRLRRREKAVKSDPRRERLSNESVQQINLGRSLTGAQYYPGNSVSIFHCGKEKFDALKDDLRQATKSINFQYYIIKDDDTGNEIADILIERAAAGVAVRVIYDHVGSFSTSNAFFKRMRRGGVSVTPFFKVTFPWLGTRINWRNHRKIVVIDDKVAYIGGMNIADRYAMGKQGKRFWRDTHLRVTGGVVAAMQYSFAVDWNFTGGGLIDDVTTGSVNDDHTPGTVKAGAQLLTSGPTGQWSNIAMAYQKVIANARRRIFIQTPYFLPTEGLLKALQSAALAHVDVRIMIPEHSDSAMLTHASASYITECLRAGIKIYLYTAGMMHAKTVLVDDEFVSIGSSNFDFRSFDYNFEANLFLYSRQANEVSAEQFRKDIVMCRRVHPAEWRNRRLSKKIAESVLRLLSPVL